MISIRISTRAALMLLALTLASGGHAAVISVTSQSTPGCTLNDAIRAANADAARGDCSAGSGVDTIRIVPSIINLNSTPQTVSSTIIIESSNANNKTIRRDPGANNTFRVLDVNNGNLTLRRLTVSGGHLRGLLDGGGAGIRVRNGSLSLDQVVVTGNLADNTGDGGAGILARDSDLSIVDSQVSSNEIVSDSGPTTLGIALLADHSEVEILRSSFVGNHSADSTNVNHFVFSPASIRDSYFSHSAITPGGSENARSLFGFFFSDTELVNSTITSDAQPGASLYNGGSVIGFLNSTINGMDLNKDSNYPSSEYEMVNSIFIGECTGASTLLPTVNNITVTSTCNSANILGPQLYPAADNGGPTFTMALHPYSNAINAGDNFLCPARDQRGELRTNGCDIGAYEFVANADVRVTAAIGTAAPTYVGQPVQINLSVSNSGPDTAHGVFVDLSLSNASLQSVDGACSMIPCTLFALEAGAPARTISVIVTPTSNPPNSFSYLASATRAANSPYVETNIGNNSASGSRSLSAAADLAISKTLLTPRPYTVGQTVNYRLRVDNLGPSNIFTGLAVSDTPSGLNLTSISNCNNSPTGPCGFTSLNAGSSITLDVAAQVTANNFDNLAEVTSNTYDPSPRNNIDDTLNGGSATATADIEVTMELQSPQPLLSGQLVEYAVKVSNNGPSPATGVRMDFDAPANQFFVTGIAGNCTPMTLPCEIGSIANGQSSTITVQGLLPFAGPVLVETTAQSDQSDSNLANNTALDSFTTQQAADIQVSLTRLSPAQAFVGQDIAYRLIVSNAGEDHADDVNITVSAQNLQIRSAIGGQCTSLPCTIGTLALMESEVIEIIAQAVAPGAFDLSASASADQIDPFPGNNVDNQGNAGTAVQPARGNLVFSDSFEGF